MLREFFLCAFLQFYSAGTSSALVSVVYNLKELFSSFVVVVCLSCERVLCIVLLLRAYSGQTQHTHLWLFFFFFFFGESFSGFFIFIFVQDELPAKTSTVLALPTQVCDHFPSPR